MTHHSMDKLPYYLKKALISAYPDLEIEIAEDELLQRSADRKFGDLSSTVAMQIARQLKQNPFTIAQNIKESLLAVLNKDGKTALDLFISKIEVVKPGFVNFTISQKGIAQILLDVDKDWRDIGKFDEGSGRKVMIEFGQPNTHKQILIGHLKSAVTGLSLVRIYENAGYEVIKSNFFGDVGMQTAKCTWGAIKKGIPDEAREWDVRKKAAFMEECYVYASKLFKDNKEAEGQIRQINKKIYKGVELANSGEKYEDTDFAVYKRLLEWSMQHQAHVWKMLGVQFDREYPESEVLEISKKILLDNADGKGNSVFETDDGAMIFRGKKYGLVNWVFLTNEGNVTYSGKDMGLAFTKLNEYPDVEKYMITTSVEQNAYFKAVIKAIELIDPEQEGKFEHLGFGWMLQGGKKTSSRKGGATNAYELIDKAQQQSMERIDLDKDYSESEAEKISLKVGLGGLKFLILSHERHKDINFKPDDMISMEGFSGPYIMYGYSRATSILKAIGKSDSNNSTTSSYAGLVVKIIEHKIGTEVFLRASEQEIVRLLALTVTTARHSLLNNSSHYICNYLFDLVKAFNRFYDECPVATEEDEDKKLIRLAIVQLFAKTVRKYLWLLGIDTVEKM